MGVIFRRRAMAAPATSLTLGPLRFRASSQRAISSSRAASADDLSNVATTSSSDRSWPDSTRWMADWIIRSLFRRFFLEHFAMTDKQREWLQTRGSICDSLHGQ